MNLCNRKYYVLYVQEQYISNQKESSETERIWDFLVYIGKENF